MYEATGTIKLINDEQTFPSGFSKREFVLTIPDGKYPQEVQFETVKDKTSLLDGFQPGQEVTVSFDLRGREYQGRYFVNLNCWKIQAGKAAGGSPGKAAAPPPSAPPSQGEPSLDDLRADDDEGDDIPF